MANANELRIGNVVRYDGLDRVVYQIRANAVDFEDFGIAVDYSGLEPIILTPELLEQFGFVKKRAEHYGYQWSNRISIVIIKDIFCCISYGHVIAQFQYLHQLQNLYFALTGQELQINIPQPVMQ